MNLFLGILATVLATVISGVLLWFLTPLKKWIYSFFSRKDIALKSLKKMKLPMTPDKFHNAMKLADKQKLFDQRSIEIELVIEMQDGTILRGVSTGAYGQNKKKGYRYYLNSKVGVQQKFYLADVKRVSHFSVRE